MLLRKTENKNLTDFLTDEEKEKFGNRCPDNYKKLGIIARGNMCIVWLAKDTVTGDMVALKQIPKPKGHCEEVVNEHIENELYFFKIV